MYREWIEKDRFAQSRKNALLKVERTSAEADSKTSYLLVQNYPKLKKIIHSQITQIKQKSIVYRITVRKWNGELMNDGLMNDGLMN